eukprot:3497434-Pyramimonas_sp.AAC.1
MVRARPGYAARSKHLLPSLNLQGEAVDRENYVHVIKKIPNTSARARDARPGRQSSTGPCYRALRIHEAGT